MLKFNNDWSTVVIDSMKQDTALHKIGVVGMRRDFYWLLSLAEEGYNARKAKWESAAKVEGRPLDIGEKMSLVSLIENLDEFAKQIVEQFPLMELKTEKVKKEVEEEGTTPRRR